MKSLLTILVSIVLSVHAQSADINNTFWEKINFFKSNENKLKDLEELVNNNIRQSNSQKAYQYAKEGLKLSLKINSQDQVSNFYKLLGDVYNAQNMWDSAYIFYDKSKTIAEKINSRNYIANAYRSMAGVKIDQGKLNEVMQYSNSALKIYTETNNKKGIAYTYHLLAVRYMQSGEIKTSFEYFFKSIRIINELGSDPLLYRNYLIMGEVHNNLGNYDSSFYYLNQVIENEKSVGNSSLAFANSLLGELYLNYGNYTKAMEYQLKALKINEKIKFKKGIAIGYSGIGSLFESKNEYKTAIKYFLKCLEIAKELKADYGIEVCFCHLGYNYYKLKEYNLAKNYLLQGLELAKKIRMPTEIGANLNYLGLIYFEQKNYDLALNYYNECLKIYQKCGFKSGVAQIYGNIGSYYQNFYQYSKAIENFNEGLKVFKEIKNKQGVVSLLLSLSQCYDKISMFKQSNECLREYTTINDSLKIENHTKRITQLEMEYEFDKKQKEQQYVQKQKEQILHAKIKNQKILIFSTTILISSLLLITLLAFRNYRLKQKNTIEIQKMEAEKKHDVDQMKLHFFANASHDIRTPLSLILGPANELMETKEFTHRSRQNIELIYRNTKLLHRFVDQILDFQKLDSNAMTLTLTNVNLIQFVKKILEAFTFHIENKNCKLELVSDLKELEIWLDTEKIEKILYNLIFNAIKFTPSNGIISIIITADEKKMYLTLKDNGVGIPEDHLDLIFKRYHQVEKNKMFYKGGSGIGLAHAKELINIHKGEISVKSNEHEGSEFIITLPRNINSSKSENVVLQTEDVKEVILKPSSEQKIIFSGKKTKEPDESINSINKHSVLVIEDDLDMHNYIVGCLQPHYNVYEAFNGTEGLKQCLKIYPDIIISDIMMDNMDGIELCNKIKTELKVCHIPVILLTALAAIENKIIGFETGADDYITKPFDSKLLLARVENIIQSRMRLREVFSKTINIEPSKITINSLDEEFLNKALKVVEKNISDCSFDVDTLCTQMHVSRSVFYRKIKALTNLASNDFIKSIRLKRSAQLLKDSDLSVSHIANEVGFIDQKYFSKSFRKYFGVSPTEFVKKVTVDE